MPCSPMSCRESVVKKPKELEVYGRAKRATIDREITDHAIDFIERKAKANSLSSPFFPIRRPMIRPTPIPTTRARPGTALRRRIGANGCLRGRASGYHRRAGAEREHHIHLYIGTMGCEGVPGSFGFTGPWRGSMFSPYEGSLRVPFLIRWPGRIPQKQESNEIVHAVDLFVTLANWVGGAIPKDRTMDGVDQSDFLMGRSEKSARESVVIYIGNELFGVKWRNWKMLLKELDENTYAIRTRRPIRSFYNLIVDPKEEHT